MNLHSKLPEVGPSIFSVMSRMSYQHDAINLSQGYPNFETDPKLIALVNDAMKTGLNFYAPMQGIVSLREAISEKVESMYHRNYNPDSEITVTAGATQAIFTAIATIINPGDEVIIFEPAYDSYKPSVEVFGGKVVPIALKGNDFKIDWQQVKDALTERTRLIMINTPHNPSGSVWQDEDYKHLSQIVKDTGIFILSDEVYESIVFDGLPYKSIAQYPELYDRSFICASFGKLYHNTGWKVGYCLAPKKLMNEFQKVHQFNVFSVNHPVQVALSKYMEDPQSYLHLSDLFQSKRDLFLSHMRASRFTFNPCKGTYFQSMSYDQISKEKDEEFAKRLCVKHKISSIPISVFSSGKNKRNMLRFCFAKTDETLIRAAKILCTI